jgi:hypothetical protein
VVPKILFCAMVWIISTWILCVCVSASVYGRKLTALSFE